MNLYINKLLKYGLDNNLLENDDYDYAANQLLYLLKMDKFSRVKLDEPVDFFEVMDAILEYAISENIIEADIVARDNFEAKIVDTMLPRPAELNRKFYELYKKGPMTATNFFYKFSSDTNYIKTRRIAKNISYVYEGKYAPLQITINLSKPEKDPKLIALKKNDNSDDYPLCQLCMENVGFYGTAEKAPRSNHRVINLTLNREKDAWGFQYSPYAYFDEHCIVLTKEHVPMKVDNTTFAELIDFVNKFPHYTIGSNAGLPIVGGSILSHYHFQGGRYTFPIESAKVIASYKLRKVEVEVLDWPLSVIRVVGNNENAIQDMVEQIFAAWQNYSLPELDIIAQTGTPHNTVTPIVKLSGSKYHFYVVLRNNRQTESRPYGLFHPREELFHIKKENIGLIEVMGLAILPGRLKDELDLIKKCLIENIPTDKYPELEKHKTWIDSLHDEALQ
ncbi:MAG: UDP-glucose--hexose-1-phosphate uridylyltransferase, partial [Bacilli bacterium]|nr:UDP-glucose--hexose-1-phosphate uridylyltransferase [Bacilli bacterium]